MGLWSFFSAWFCKFYAGVVVDEIQPNYYAANVVVDNYVVVGRGFNLIPMDAVGIFANSNPAPLEFIETSSPDLLFDISEKTNTRMVLVSRSPIAHVKDSFLGGIVSNDRQTVFWTNDTRPLP